MRISDWSSDVCSSDLGLRADVAFYERFVGAPGQRRGLTVHQLHLQPQSDQAWHFTTTLTQNLNRGADSSGQVTLSVEGTSDGKLQTLDWDALRQQPGAAGIAYACTRTEENKSEPQHQMRLLSPVFC